MSLDPTHKVKKATLGDRKQQELIISKGAQDAKMPPGHVIGPIIRDFLVVKYCTGGKGVLTVNDQSFPIQEGQCYVALPGDVVVETADLHDPWSHVWLVFDGVRAAMLFMNLGISTKTPVFPWKSNPKLLNRFIHTIKACANPVEDTELRRIAYAYLFLDQLTCYYHKNCSRSSSESAEDKYIREAIYYMEANCHSKLKIADVAAHIGLNRSYFYSIFKAHTNLSPQSYLTRLRMKKACELFSYPHATVTSVANSLGYDPTAFFRHFKAIVGMSPSEYKKRISRDGLDGLK